MLEALQVGTIIIVNFRQFCYVVSTVDFGDVFIIVKAGQLWVDRVITQSL